MTLISIKILWMDGREATFHDVTTSIREGVLHVHKYKSGIIEHEWHLPVSNIRWWTPLLNGDPGPILDA